MIPTPLLFFACWVWAHNSFLWTARYSLCPWRQTLFHSVSWRFLFGDDTSIYLQLFVLWLYKWSGGGQRIFKLCNWDWLKTVRIFGEILSEFPSPRQAWYRLCPWNVIRSHWVLRLFFVLSFICLWVFFFRKIFYLLCNVCKWTFRDWHRRREILTNVFSQTNTTLLISIEIHNYIYL